MFSCKLRPVNAFVHLNNSTKLLHSARCRQNQVLRPRLTAISIGNWLHTSCSVSQNDLPQTSFKQYMQGVKATSIKIPRKPFIKNLFVGDIDKNVLAFPEVLNYDELACMGKMIDATTTFMNFNINSDTLDRQANIPDEVIEGFKSLGLFSATGPVDMGGLNLKQTELVWLMDRVGVDSSVGFALGSHLSLVNQLNKSLNDEQKRKYMPGLSTGETIVAFCATETDAGCDPAMIKTTVTKSGENFVLNGRKMWVTNANIADYFIVLGKSTIVDHTGEIMDVVGAFIVDKNSAGVTISKSYGKNGLRGLNTSTVELKDVLVSKENIINNVESGFEFTNGLMDHARLLQSAQTVGLMKELVDYTIKHCIDRVQFRKPIMEFEMVEERVAYLVAKTYAAESMVHFAASLFDSTTEPDLALENAATKFYTSELLLQCVNECTQLLGANALLDDSPLGRVSRDARAFTLVNGSNDIIRLLIALSGLSNTGKVTADQVEKMRNPLFNPKFALFKIISHEKAKRGYFSFKMDLAGYLHESLATEAKMLEVACTRFYYAVQTVLVRYGQEVVSKQMELRRIADIAMSIYLLTAILSRCSRSYCIGLPHASVEVNLVKMLGMSTYAEIIKMADELENGPFATIDACSTVVAKDIFKAKRYAPVIPALRNY